jgi:hypothetical protein
VKTKIIELKNVELDSIEQGLEIVDGIDEQIRTINEKLKATAENKVWDALQNDKYELIKAKRAILGKLGAMAHERYLDKQIKEGK